jgi:hypothetical protein
MSKMEILVRIYREAIESKMFAEDIESISGDQLETLLELLRQAVDVTTQTAQDPLRRSGAQPTENFQPQLGQWTLSEGMNPSGTTELAISSNVVYDPSQAIDPCMLYNGELGWDWPLAEIPNENGYFVARDPLPQTFENSANRPRTTVPPTTEFGLGDCRIGR